MEMQWNYAPSEQLTVAMFCSPALDSGISQWYHVFQTGYIFLCSNWHLPSFPYTPGWVAFQQTFQITTWENVGLGICEKQCERMMYLKLLPAIFHCTYVHL